MSASTPNGWALPLLYVICRDLKRIAKAVRPFGIPSTLYSQLRHIVVVMVGRRTTSGTRGETNEIRRSLAIVAEMLFGVSE